MVQELAHALVLVLLLLLAAAGLGCAGVRRQDAPVAMAMATQALVCIVFFPTTRRLAPAFVRTTIYAARGVEA